MDPNNINLDLLYKLVEISQRMAETRTLDPLLQYAISEAMGLVGAERGYLVLLDDTGAIEFKVKRGADGRDINDADDQISRTVLDRVITSGEPLILQNAIDNSDFGQALSIRRLQLRSVMGVPLISRQNTIGAIYVENRSRAGQFQDEDLTPLVFFANQAAVFVENAKLNDELENRVAARTSELEQAMVRLEESWMEAVEANRLQTTMLANIAHDLRSPLSLAKTALTMMQYGEFGDLNEEQHQWIVTSMHSIDQSFNLIEDVFLLTVKEMKGIKLAVDEVDLTEFLTLIHSIGTGLPWQEGVKFELALEQLPPSIQIDPHRMQQVLLNLLSNSLKYTLEGRVVLHAHESDLNNQVIIGVRDTGIGIPESMSEKIFERFQQVSDTEGRNRYGTGLGLAICKDLVEMHGGKIWVESNRPSGSDFKFTLPLRQPTVEW